MHACKRTSAHARAAMQTPRDMHTQRVCVCESAPACMPVPPCAADDPGPERVPEGETEAGRRLREAITADVHSYFEHSSKQLLAQKGQPLPE